MANVGEFSWSWFLGEPHRLRACLHEGGGPQVGEVTCGGLHHLTCKRDHIKMKDYMDKRVTSPTWGPPPPCKQALRKRKGNVVTCLHRP